jgi:hypothetical protein
LKEFDASFEGEKPKAPPIAFKPAPSAPKAPVAARNSLDDLLKKFDGAFKPDGTLTHPPSAENAKPFTFMSAIPKKKDPEIAPAPAPMMAGP